MPQTLENYSWQFPRAERTYLLDDPVFPLLGLCQKQTERAFTQRPMDECSKGASSPTAPDWKHPPRPPGGGQIIISWHVYIEEY